MSRKAIQALKDGTLTPGTLPASVKHLDALAKSLRVFMPLETPATRLRTKNDAIAIETVLAAIAAAEAQLAALKTPVGVDARDVLELCRAFIAPQAKAMPTAVRREAVQMLLNSIDRILSALKAESGAGCVVVPVADLQEACDLLAERRYGDPARSPGHNARLLLEGLLAASPTPRGEG